MSLELRQFPKTFGVIFFVGLESHAATVYERIALFLPSPAERASA